MEYPKWLYLDSYERGIIVSDADEETIAREKGFGDSVVEPQTIPADEDERELLKVKLKEAGVSFGGNTGTAKLKEMVAALG